MIVTPWFLLMMMEAYKFGIKPKQLPEPYHFILPSMAMGFCAIIASFNGTIGGLLAWGLFLGAALSTANTYKSAAASPQAPAPKAS